MAPVEMVSVRCLGCDNWFSFPKHIISAMRMPGGFCVTCFNGNNEETKRRWFAYDLLHQQVQALYQQVQAHEAALR